MSITTKWLLEHGYTIGPDGGWYKGVAPAAPLQNSLTQPDSGHGGEAKDSGKEESPRRRIRVCVTSYRRRLLDTDNLFVKWLVDGLRYSKIIPEDSPQHIELIVNQEKVALKEHERTEIVVT